MNKAEERERNFRERAEETQGKLDATSVLLKQRYPARFVVPPRDLNSTVRLLFQDQLR